MPKRKRRISYEAMAALSIGCGSIAVAAAIGVPFIPGATAEEPSALAQAAGALGALAWLFGAAAGVLVASTPLKRYGLAGLALCGVALIAVAVRSIGG